MILTLVIKAIDKEILIIFFYPIEINLQIELQISGIVFILIGFLFIIWANYVLLNVNKISLKDREPFHVPSSLALTGPYKLSRNPIYFGVLLAIFGFFIIIESITVLILNILCFLIFRIGLIRWEEEHLENKFGQDYINYKKRVRRWI